MTSSPSKIIGSMPPPPGQVANFIDPPSQMKGNIALHTICLTLVTLCIAVRLYTRRFLNRELGLDDYLIVVSYALTITFSGLQIEGDMKGLGRHLWDVPAVELPDALKALTISEFVYLALAGTIKLSCLLFYRRIFAPNKTTLRFVYGGIGFIFVAYTAIFFTTIFECTPIEKVGIKAFLAIAIKKKVLPYFSGAINVVTDIYVLALPIPALWGLNLGLNRKLRVMAILVSEFFASITSIIRLVMTSTLYTDLDATWNLSQIGIWAVIEVNVGIVCSCMLAFPAFIKRFWPKEFGASLTRLLQTTFRGTRSERTGGTGGSNNNYPATVWPRSKISETGDLEYVKLKNGSDMYTTKAAEKPSKTSHSNEDLEAWGRQSSL